MSFQNDKSDKYFAILHPEIQGTHYFRVYLSFLKMPEFNFASSLWGHKFYKDERHDKINTIDHQRYRP